MGGSSSTRNVSNMMINDQQSLLSRIISNAAASTNQSQGISVENVAGDVNVSGNAFAQTATVDLSAAFSAVSSAAAQQTLAAAVEQSAKSLTSGVSIASSSDASNEANTYINVSSSVTNDIENTCYTHLAQMQNISVKNVGGNVTLDNNSFSQIGQAMATCFAQSAADSTAVQSLQATVGQSASATTDGFSMVALYGILICGGVAGAYVGLPYASQYLVYIMCGVVAVVGVVILGFGWKLSPRVADTTQYSTLLTGCGASQLKTYTGSTALAAAADCIANTDCAGFDVTGYKLNTANTEIDTVFIPPNVTLYSTFPATCDTILSTPDTAKLIYPANYGSGAGEPLPPTTPIGTIAKPNIWLNTVTSDVYTLNQLTNEWTKFTTLSSAFDLTTAPAMWAAQAPKTPPDTTIIVDPQTPATPSKFALTLGKKTAKVDGPGFLIMTPPVINTSGHAYTKWNWLLLGAGALVSGGAGLTLIFYMLFVQPKMLAQRGAFTTTTTKSDNKVTPGATVH